MVLILQQQRDLPMVSLPLLLKKKAEFTIVDTIQPLLLYNNGEIRKITPLLQTPLLQNNNGVIHPLQNNNGVIRPLRGSRSPQNALFFKDMTHVPPVG
jgi:hypothetical protein